MIRDLFHPHLVRKCSKCGVTKEISEFYKKIGNKNNLDKRCNVCVKKYNNLFYNDNHEKYQETKLRYFQTHKEENKIRSRKHYDTDKGRILSWMRTIRVRSLQRNWASDIDYNFLEKLLETRHCAVTKIEFQFTKDEGKSRNPFAPSLDRIDSRLPYMKSNVRLVIWQYNLMKGEMLDHEIRFICQKVIEHGRAD